MFKSLELFQTAHAMAFHAGQRQAVIATNIANADTPGYRARDIASFSDSYRAAGPNAMRASRPGHLHGAPDGADLVSFTIDSNDSSPNGNSVSIEAELLKGVEVQRQHEKAIAIYRSGLNILRSSLGRR